MDRIELAEEFGSAYPRIASHLRRCYHRPRDRGAEILKGAVTGLALGPFAGSTSMQDSWEVAEAINPDRRSAQLTLTAVAPLGERKVQNVVEFRAEDARTIIDDYRLAPALAAPCALLGGGRHQLQSAARALRRSPAHGR